MFSKKRYAGRMHENADKPDDFVYKYMGIALKRRDNAPIVKNIYGAAMKKVLDEKKQKESQLIGTQYYIQSCVESLLHIMEETSIITNVEPGCYALTQELGTIASRMAEINPVLISLVCVQWKYFEEFTVSQIVGFLSLFTDVRVIEDSRVAIANCSYDNFLVNKVREFDQNRESIISKEEYK
jgi:hypothetical protein